MTVFRSLELVQRGRTAMKFTSGGTTKVAVVDAELVLGRTRILICDASRRNDEGRKYGLISGRN